ncbi:hypothetical protein HYPSUDRAFT_61027 [Hypholoma sublateritium FD-334 SS-4]|uniref:Gfd2/YDR514C-like C-terminal domain-containing protein n=1 Tax=Hypholoma sublateritium (strain FD-334 SS-4) TaxID=945553 RepID=A0A0D2PQ12_HYPSF|nr:hypothetical protein HYPSUDRAFT_61027 [Hypholoma sublateritium FD-334 SS-4]
MPQDSPVVTGYYRYTDIWFEWHQALPDLEDRAPVKAIFAHDALVHPDHPLHIEGVEGIRMYIGTFDSGEARLLFSSAQVDYLRYWLHAMKLTKTIVPLPYSDCLLTESLLKTVSPVVYSDGFTLRNAIKVIDKNNKRLKGSNPSLTHRRHLFERVRTLWTAKKGVWCAADIESWERDHTVLTEFGWSTIGWKDGEKFEENGHLIVDEARKYTNSQYVPDHRYDYMFENKSEIVKKSIFEKRIRDLVAGLAKYGPVYLVFHDNTQDIKDLNKLGVDFQGLSYILPEGLAESGIWVVDTVELIGALLGEEGNKRSLDKATNLLGITTQHLHNAGNDAYYILKALENMASGDPLDMQREKRWPLQTPAGVKVELKPWQEDSDYSDEEGVLPAPYAAKVPST